jgi:hypothetical protein
MIKQPCWLDFINWKWARDIWEEKTLAERMLPVDWSVSNILLINELCGRAQPTVGGAIPWLLFFCCLRKQAEWTRKRKPQAEFLHLCFSFCLQLPDLSFFPSIPWWQTVSCKPKKSLSSTSCLWSVFYQSNRMQTKTTALSYSYAVSMPMLWHVYYYFQSTITDLCGILALIKMHTPVGIKMINCFTSGGLA